MIRFLLGLTSPSPAVVYVGRKISDKIRNGRQRGRASSPNGDDAGP